MFDPTSLVYSIDADDRNQPRILYALFSLLQPFKLSIHLSINEIHKTNESPPTMAQFFFTRSALIYHFVFLSSKRDLGLEEIKSFSKLL